MSALFQRVSAGTVISCLEQIDFFLARELAYARHMRFFVLGDPRKLPPQEVTSLGGGELRALFLLRRVPR